MLFCFYFCVGSPPPFSFAVAEYIGIECREDDAEYGNQ